ncbi:MAG: substrate-binding domain-containing protein, partial [Oscillospiraceae bacterium]|nr:substrate-binding domain-containing protein [Oscillospiraceae bacterium]
KDHEGKRALDYFDGNERLRAYHLRVRREGADRVAGDVNLDLYHPWNRSHRLPQLDSPPSFRISGNFPRLNGATSAYPIYAAIANEVFTVSDKTALRRHVLVSGTTTAYNMLIRGEADIIFVLQPSYEQLQLARDAGVELHFTPIARDAFVFFVNRRNPVSGLTTEQIRDIYRGNITNWQEVGGNDSEIVAFQRPANSGSQTAMINEVMKSEELPPPLMLERRIQTMGGMIHQVAQYRNYEDAIGYSFRFFTEEMMRSTFEERSSEANFFQLMLDLIPDDPDLHERREKYQDEINSIIAPVKLLAVDGIYPSKENIRNGTYPFTVDVFAVTAGTTNPHVRELIAWMLSPQGQELIEKTGYVGGVADYHARQNDAHIELAAIYAQAEAALLEGDYESALDGFRALGDFSDARARVQEVLQAKILAAIYERAEAAFSRGDYEDALGGFRALGNFKDAEARALEVLQAKEFYAIYTQAEAALLNGDYRAAIDGFMALGNYRNARSRAEKILETIIVEATGSELTWSYISSTILSNVLAAGDSHFVGLRADNTVVAAGDNRFGQSEVSDWEDIIAVAAAGNYTVGLRADGTVVTTGRADGRYGTSDWKDIVAVAVGSHIVGLRSDGTVIAAGDSLFVPAERLNVSHWNDIVAIAAGTNHTVGLRADGTVIAAGDNRQGQCNVSDWNDIIAIAAGANHTVGLRIDGTVAAVGDNGHGQSSVSNWSGIIAIAAAGEHTVGLRADGAVVAVGYNRYRQYNVSAWNGIVAIAAGLNRAIGLRAGGTVIATTLPARQSRRFSHGTGSYDLTEWNIDWLQIAIDQATRMRMTE